MSLRLYNTLTKTKEDFVPLDPNNVRMYVCGPTVYDYAHIGNARPVIVFDVLYRLLQHLYPGEGTASDGSRVTYVRNITDVDDKINARAKDEGISIRELTERTAKIYNEDVAALGNLPPTHTPRATEHIAEMIAMIADLIAAGHAYVAEGHVLFDVSSKPDYGKLSRRSLDEMIAGSRVEVAPYKKSPMDFVMWKPSDVETPGWESPWGRGRPGWHIECSAMSARYLGETFDIHGGGIDLVFPHHENEIAQSEGAHRDHPFAKVWMHNGHLQVEGDKMSKSLGNFVTINELLTTDKFGGRDWSGDALRFNMLRTHYRQPTDWTLRSLEDSDITMYHWLSKADDVSGRVVPFSNERAFRVHPEFRDALFDDLNTPLAIAELHKIDGEMSSAYDSDDAKYELYAEYFLTGLHLLGLYDLKSDVREYRLSQKKLRIQSVSPEVEPLIEARLAARKAKNFKESDRIRDELAAQGIVLKDNPDGTTTWDVKR